MKQTQYKYKVIAKYKEEPVQELEKTLNQENDHLRLIEVIETDALFIIVWEL